MSDAWERVGETVKRRRAELGLSQRAAARLADDLSPTTWNNLERHHAPMSALSQASICKALGWTIDSIDRVLAGLDPLEDEHARRTPTMEDLAVSLERVTAAVENLADRVAALERPRRK